MADSQIEHVRRGTQAEVPQKMVDIGGGVYAASVAVSGSVTVADGGGSLTVDGPLTDAQLLARLPLTTLDGGCAWVSSYLHVASADASSGVDATAAPTSGQKIVVDDIFLSTLVELTVTFEEETSGTDVLVLYMPARGNWQLTPRGRLKLSAADKKLRLKTDGAGQVAVTVFYHSEA